MPTRPSREPTCSQRSGVARTVGREPDGVLAVTPEPQAVLLVGAAPAAIPHPWPWRTVVMAVAYCPTAGPHACPTLASVQLRV